MLLYRLFAAPKEIFVSDCDKDTFQQVVHSFADGLRQFGLEVRRFRVETTDTDGLMATAATWPRKTITVCVFRDRCLGQGEPKFWFGFAAENRVTLDELIADLPRRFKHYAHIRPEDWQGKEPKLHYSDHGRVKAIEMNWLVLEDKFHESDAFFGKYEMGFQLKKSNQLTTEAVRFIGEIVEYVDPSLAEQLDIKRLEKEKPTEYKQLILARRGQGKFRRDLETQWDNACAVTGCIIRETLRASHIMPWRQANNEQRLDKNNGLLLIATLDALFDKGLISFDDEGRILGSRDLFENNRNLAPDIAGMRLLKPLSPEQKTYLRMHREKAEKTLGAKLISPSN
jgi:predicted restriction endonuclease